MPEIARFYGIAIKLFFGDHLPPHFHAVYGEYVGLFDLPSRAKNLVIEWAKANQTELLEIWNTQEFRKLPPLK